MLDITYTQIGVEICKYLDIIVNGWVWTIFIVSLKEKKLYE